MTTYAHEKDLTVYDPQPNSSLSGYLNRFNAATVYGWIVDGHTFKAVPDGTEHGAHDNEDGTYTNPPPPPEPPQENPPA